MRDWNLQIIFEPRDAWIGVYWNRIGNAMDVYICLLPFLPLHFSCWGKRWGMPSLDPDDTNT